MKEQIKDITTIMEKKASIVDVKKLIPIIGMIFSILTIDR